MLKHGVSRNLIKDYVYSLNIVFFSEKIWKCSLKQQKKKKWAFIHSCLFARRNLPSIVVMFRVICLSRKKNQEIGNDGAAEQYRGRCRKTINKQNSGWSKSLFESHLVKRLLSVQIQSTKLTKFVTLHKTSPEV